MRDQAIRMRLTYRKVGPLRFISHRDLIQVLTRALRRAGTPLAFTQGYSPRPKLSFAPPLPLGVEGRAELLDIELSRHLDERDFLFQVNEAVPDGLEFTDAMNLLAGAPGLSELAVRCRYSFEPLDGDVPAPRCAEVLAAATLTVTKQRKKDDVPKVSEVRQLLHALSCRDGGAEADVAAAPLTISPFDMAKFLWPDLSVQPLEALAISRLGFVTAEGQALYRKG